MWKTLSNQLSGIKILFKLLHKCHCRRKAGLIHSDRRHQASTSESPSFQPRPSERWQCSWMPERDPRQRSWTAAKRSPLSFQVCRCLEYPLNEARAETPPSPTLPGPARENSTMLHSALDFNCIMEPWGGLSRTWPLGMIIQCSALWYGRTNENKS